MQGFALFVPPHSKNVLLRKTGLNNVLLPTLFKMFSINNIVQEGLQSVLRIGSAHNKGGPPNVNFVQISHFSNSLN